MAKNEQKPTCPACGGETVTTIKHLGELYYQCLSIRPATPQREAGPCKYWSTKWSPTGGA